MRQGLLSRLLGAGVVFSTAALAACGSPETATRKEAEDAAREAVEKRASALGDTDAERRVELTASR